MGVSRDVSGAAHAAACAVVREHPKLAHWLLYEQTEARPVLANFKEDWAIIRYLREIKVTRHEAELLALIHRADDFVHGGGQAARVAALYAKQESDGRLDGMWPSRLAVHRAAFAIAYAFGAPALASLRLIQTVVHEQSGVPISHSVVNKQLAKLQRDGLLTYAPGSPGIYNARSGLIVLDDLPAGVDDLAHEVVHLLTLTSTTRQAIADYQQHARKDRERRSRSAEVRYEPVRDARAAEVTANAYLHAITRDSADLSHVLDGIDLD